jgi:hypothetical protein
MHAPRLVITLLLAAAATAACGISTPSSNTIETFSGTLEVGGSQRHEFRAGRAGEFEITVTSLTPDGSVFVGTQVAQVAGGSCSVLLGRNFFSVVGRLSLNGPISSGQYCVDIFDSGYLARAQSYTLRVSRP